MRWKGPSGQNAGGLQKQDQHHNGGHIADDDGVQGLAGELAAALFHLLRNELGFEHPADENGGQKGDQGHHYAVADVVHNVQQLGGGAVG